MCDAFSHGAVGDGVTDDTAALQSAITACASPTGGLVTLGATTPGGAPAVFLSFGLVVPVTSNFGLRVDGVLRFSTNTTAWSHSNSACITFLSGSQFVAVYSGSGTPSGVGRGAAAGAGIIDGQGAAWWPNPKAFRPNLVNANVHDMLWLNIVVQDSPNHTLELLSNSVEVVEVSILAPSSVDPTTPSHNTDGIDVHGSPFWIHRSRISVGDDHVAFHANDTLVDDCDFGTGHGTSIGSLGMGTVLSNITVSNADFVNPTAAVRIKADPTSSGDVGHVLFANLTVSGAAMTIDVTAQYPHPAPPAESTLLLHDLTFSNISSSDAVWAGEFDCSTVTACVRIVVQGVVHTGAPPKPWVCTNAHGVASGVVPPLCLEA